MGKAINEAGNIFKRVADGITDQKGQAVGETTDKVGKIPGKAVGWAEEE